MGAIEKEEATPGDRSGHRLSQRGGQLGKSGLASTIDGSRPQRSGFAEQRLVPGVFETRAHQQGAPAASFGEAPQEVQTRLGPLEVDRRGRVFPRLEVPGAME